MGPGISGDMGLEMNKMKLEHLVIPESKEGNKDNSDMPKVEASDCKRRPGNKLGTM